MADRAKGCGRGWPVERENKICGNHRKSTITSELHLKNKDLRKSLRKKQKRGFHLRKAWLFLVSSNGRHVAAFNVNAGTWRAEHMKRIASHKLFSALSTYMWRGFDALCDRDTSIQIANPGQPSCAGALMTA